MTVMLATAATAPLWSVTTPVISPKVCARAETLRSSNIPATQHTLWIIEDPPMGCFNIRKCARSQRGCGIFGVLALIRLAEYAGHLAILRCSAGRYQSTWLRFLIMQQVLLSKTSTQ